MRLPLALIHTDRVCFDFNPGVFKLADFGLATLLSTGTKPNADVDGGDNRYVAPYAELLSSAEPAKTDMFSVGATLLELVRRLRVAYIS